ncbi:hypothetical protein [Simiduia agarivorans]|uniref:hypothetical protein n=1 Tax=Simiduia agarivorans TaxID=447471 RepID=UPI000462A5AB|nr:hypothetical protein [Simiduia agarivorans]
MAREGHLSGVPPWMAVAGDPLKLPGANEPEGRGGGVAFLLVRFLWPNKENEQPPEQYNTHYLHVGQKTFSNLSINVGRQFI